VTLTFDLLTLKVMFESRATWATSVPILVLLGFSVLDLGPMYATDRHQADIRQASDVRQKHRSMPPPIRGGEIIKVVVEFIQHYLVVTSKALAASRISVADLFV